MFKRDYIVQLTVTSSHEYTVQAISEEDATERAVALFENGDQGILIDFDVETVDVVDSFGQDDDAEDDEDFD